MGGRFQKIFNAQPRLPQHNYVKTPSPGVEVHALIVRQTSGQRNHRPKKTNPDPTKQKMNGNTARIPSQPTSSPMKQGIPCNETCRKCSRLCVCASRGHGVEKGTSSQKNLGPARRALEQSEPGSDKSSQKQLDIHKSRSHEARSNQKQPHGQEKPRAARSSQVGGHACERE